MVGKRAVKSGFFIEFIVARLPTLQILFQMGGMVGKRAVKSGFFIEFIVARLPTLQILGEKKVAKIPEQTHPRVILSYIKSL